MTGPNVTIRASGDGFELLDDKGEVVAWTLDRKWALKILLGLELLEGSDRQETPEPKDDGDAN